MPALSKVSGGLFTQVNVEVKVSSYEPIIATDS